MNIRELNYPDIAALQNQLLLDTELIVPLHSVANLKAESRITMRKEVHPELPIGRNLPGYDALVQHISKLNPDSKKPPPLSTSEASEETESATKTTEKNRSYNETTVTASEIDFTALTVQVDEGPLPPKIASKVEVVRKNSTSSQSKRSSKVISPATRNWGQYTIPTYPPASPSTV